MFIANVVVIIIRFEDLQLPSRRDFFRWLPVSFLVSGMLGTSIFALEGTTVSTVTRKNKQHMFNDSHIYRYKCKRSKTQGTLATKP